MPEVSMEGVVIGVIGFCGFGGHGVMFGHSVI